MEAETTVHQVWQHAATNEIWAVRLKSQTPTGVFGPIGCTPSVDVLPELPYEDHSDDLDWVVRSAGLAIAAGLLGAAYPAWIASRKDPIEALAYE